MSLSGDCLFHICRPLRGLVCGLKRKTLKGMKIYVPLVCNPSTGQCLVLPKVKKSRNGVIGRFCLGYDPIDNQSKILARTYPLDQRPDYFENKCYVLTLGTGKSLSWRVIECDIPHNSAAVDPGKSCNLYDEICIQGVCYYLAWLHKKVPVVISFSVRFEKFKFIRMAQGMDICLKTYLPSTLMKYKGELAKLQLNIVGGVCTGIQLWVLKDAEKHEWLNSIYVLPPPLEDMVRGICVGTTATGDIVLSLKNRYYFYLRYYNPERETVTEVEIQGMEAYMGYIGCTFLDHVEDVKLMAST